ncbi:MAG TPA: hypothetical protein VFV86_06525 [Nitrososphaeraceae archaeon]|nr:hypothetical protein [Nitrososphaeraceae archaeon]
MSRSNVQNTKIFYEFLITEHNTPKCKVERLQSLRNRTDKRENELKYQEGINRQFQILKMEMVI